MTATVESLTSSAPATYVDGTWADGDGEEFESLNPATGEVLASIRSSSIEQVDAAISAARRSFDAGGWKGAEPAVRAQALRRLASLIEENAEELARLVVDEVGSPIALSRFLQVGQPPKNFRWMADAALRGPVGGYETRLPASQGAAPADSVILREAVGVVAAVVPYNYPINLISWKVGAALAAGCSVVLLPSPQGAQCAVAFMRLADRAGIPPGVLNLVVGGIDVSRRLVSHPSVDMVSFTGSSATGAAIMGLAAQTTKKVVLELGGKSANIVLPGADLGAVVEASILRYARNAGQGCGSTTRILVHRDQYDEFVQRARAVMSDSVTVGDPHLDDTVVGPLISAEHRARVDGYVERALAAGAEVVAQTERPLPEDGFFHQAMLVGNVTNDAEISQEELFAPVGVLLVYDTVDEAVAMANDSKYALNAAVWGDVDEALAVARRLESGTVAVNGGGDQRPDVSWGGGKLSGVGVEMGEEGFSEFFAVKHVQWPVAGR